VRTTDSQLTKVTDPVTNLQAQNDRFMAENDKVKQHYKQLYDSIKITRAKHIEQVTKLTAENVTLKISVSKAKVQPSVVTRTKHAVDVELIVPRLRNNRDAHLDYLRHLEESVETIRDIVEEAKVLHSALSGIIGVCDWHLSLRLLTTRLKRTVINLNSDSICQTCNKCLTSFDHDMSVAGYVKSVVLPHSTRHNCEVERKIKQVWKPNNVARKITQVWKPKQVGKVWKLTGKVLTTIGHQWRPTGWILHLGTQCPLTRFTPPQVVSAAQSKKHANTCANQKEPNHNWGSKVSNSPSLSCFKCRSYRSSFVRFGNDYFGAIMGYGDYVVGESVISKVYYVEGLGHNLFSVRQFCDSDLEVAFRKHSCYVRDMNGVDLIKGSRGSNLYTISVEDMMKSSPICLLSKSSKNKSWLWHRRLNHLNFGTINDLARKDLVRELPRLKLKRIIFASHVNLERAKSIPTNPKLKTPIWKF
nr:integrase, catalytic region, zinc finger, CCHC-type, peptidase aspartic, catalytic [Tanacetum cinerariifolium]